MTIRLGAVGYLNARPLTWALDRAPDRWQIRYDFPSVCSALLKAGEVDLGLVPSIDYLDAADYRLVPGVGIGSRGPVASVALFTRMPIEAVRRIALDTSSRTSVALVKVLCHHRFHIEPEFVPHGPDLGAMTRGSDAALLIGDPALETDPDSLGVTKVDLGSEWHALTGLPFVYAVWTGREGAAGAAHVAELNAARDRGVAVIADIARRVGRGNPRATDRALRYLRDNLKYALGDRELAGLRRFHELAAESGLVPGLRDLRFYG